MTRQLLKEFGNLPMCRSDTGIDAGRDRATVDTRLRRRTTIQARRRRGLHAVGGNRLARRAQAASNAHLGQA